MLPFLLLLALFSTADALCSPSDADFDGWRYPEHIAHCQRNVRDSVKAQVAARYGIARAQWSEYEFDHVVPLSIGGSNATANIWPQPLTEADRKDAQEDQLYYLLRDGKITQANAVKLMLAWWAPPPAGK